MAAAAIAVGNLTTTALYVASFHAQVFADSDYDTLLGSKSCPAVKDGDGNWVQANMMAFPGLVKGHTYYIQAGPVSPAGVANFSRFSIVAGDVTIPACTFSGSYVSTVAGIDYDIQPGSVPGDIDHYEAIWTKDSSEPDNDSPAYFWSGQPLGNGYLHFSAGGSEGQTIHLYMRGISKSGGYQDWIPVDSRTVTTYSSGSTDAADLFYADGTSVEALKPAAAGADVTAVNISADTATVGGRNSEEVANTVLLGGGVNLASGSNINGRQNANNLLIRGSFEDGSTGTWGPGCGISGVGGQDFTKALTFWVRDTEEFGNVIPVTPGTRIYVDGWLATLNIPGGYGGVSVGMEFRNAAGTPFTWEGAFGLSEAQNWTHQSGFFTVPSGAVFGVPWLQISHDASSLNPSYYGQVANLFFTKSPIVDFSDTHVNKNAGNIPYTDGNTVQSLQPAQVGADMTSAQPIVYSGLSGNLIPNGDFILGNADDWQTGGAYWTGSYLLVDSNQSAFSGTFAVQPGNKYRFTFYGFPGNAVNTGNYHRVFWGSQYHPNISDSGVGGYLGYQDFLSNGSLAAGSQIYTYDWVAPSDARYASLAVYNLGSSGSGYTRFIAQDYGASGQWGADVTGSNTANNTNNVASVPASTIASVVPNGYKLYINSGSRSYSITAI